MSVATPQSDGDARPALDPLDLASAPWGAYQPSQRLQRLRALVIAERGPSFVRRWLYKSFTHLTKQRQWIIDLEYLGARRRLFIDENGQDRHVFRRGRHPEEEELLSFAAYRDKKAVFVDIGGNNGYFAVAAARALGPGARILSFEPHPRTYRKLLLHLALNDARTVEAVNAGLGPEETVMTLHEAENADGRNSFMRGGDDGIEVPVTPLLTALETRGIDRIDLLKIDVEGFEDQVLAPFFATAPPSLWPGRVFMEVTNRDRSWSVDLLPLMAELGYRTVKETADNVWFERDAAAGGAGAPRTDGS